MQYIIRGNDGGNGEPPGVVGGRPAIVTKQSRGGIYSSELLRVSTGQATQNIGSARLSRDDQNATNCRGVSRMKTMGAYVNLDGNVVQRHELCRCNLTQ